MRYREFLLEYDRQKTIDNWMPRLRERILRDTSIRGQDFMVGLDIARDAYRAIKMAKDFPENARGRPPSNVKTADQEVMHFIEQCDPTGATKQYSYVPWIIQRYLDGGIALAEDLRAKVEPWLAIYDRLKKTGWFRRNPEAAQWGDIGRFKRLSDLGRFIQPFLDTEVKSNAEMDRDEEKRLIERKAATILADTPTLKVLIPHTWEASKYFGRNTQWCTAMKDNSAFFNRYDSQGHLYIVLDKPNNRRFQLHFESGQFMDETDSPIDDDDSDGWAGFPAEAWQYIDVTKMDDLAKANFLARSYCITEFDKVKKSCDTRTLALASAWAGSYFINPGVPASMSKKVGGEINVFNSLESFIGYTIRHHDIFYDHDSQDDDENPICKLMDILRGEIPGTDYAPTWWDVDEIFNSFRNCAVFEMVESEDENATYMMFLETADHESGLSQIKNATAVVVKLGSLQTFVYGTDDLDIILKSKTDVTQDRIGLALAYLIEHAK